MKSLAFVAALVASPALADMKIEIPFEVQIGGQPLSCAASYADIGTTKSTVQVADFRVYVSNFRMIGADGSEVPVALDNDGTWQLDGTALLDFEDGTGTCLNGTVETNMVVRGTVPDGEYAGLLFDIGVPFAQNHGDPTLAASPLNLTAMFWSWQAGYKFIKIDMATSGQPLPPPMKMGMASGDMASGDMAKADDAPKMDMSGPMGWEIHLGSTGCASDSQTTSPKDLCANPNRMAIRLDGFMPGMEGMDKVVLDPAPVLAAANVDVNAKETMPGCMAFPGDADCPPVMAALGLSYEGAAPGAQVFATLH
jgi:uncharacterized repeat protein (TIGR04052 family)